MKENEKELFPLMPESVKEGLASSLLRAVRKWKGATEEQLRDYEERERRAQGMLLAQKVTKLTEAAK